MSTTFLLLLLLGTAFAATHVNISIAQHQVDNLDNAKPNADLKLESKSAHRQHHSDFSYRDDGNHERSSRLQDGRSRAYVHHDGGSSASNQHAHNNHHFYSESRSARLQQANSASNAGQKQLNPMHAMNGRHEERQAFRAGGMSQQQQQQPKLQHPQDKQNQEFERYIQNYHSGPTVETVYESASPAPERYSQSSSSSSFSSSSSSSADSSPAVVIGMKSPNAHTFERQVALPTVPPNLLPSGEEDRQTHVISNHQPKPITENTQDNPPPASSSSSSSVGSSSSSSTSGGGQYDLNQGSNSYDQPNFDASINYNKPNYDQSNYNYDDSQQSDFHDQLPPSVDESQGGGYGGYYGGNDQTHFYGQSPPPSAGYTPQSGYLPPQPNYQRPVVTKTIQIAQPALKAKKYEIRHPAIQKEFYDIEERVVIKPAGTIVVELERPVAKIPKGETILPLGHPHPAVASAYNTNNQNVIQTQTSTSSSSFSNAGFGGHNNNNNNNQYSPSPVYSPRPDRPAIASTIASTITTTPSYDQNQAAKEDFVEANLNKQYSGELQPQFVPTTERNYNEEKQSNEEFYYVTDSQGNQRQVSTKNFTPNMFVQKDETDYREVKNNVAPTQQQVNTNSYSNNQQQQPNYNYNGQASFAPAHQQYPLNYNTNQYKGEHFAPEYFNNANHQQDFKPARLQEAPKEKPMQASGAQTHIHLSPTQHHIYLGQMEQMQQEGAKQQQQQQQQLRQSRYNEEAARVLEVKPYLQSHKGPVVVYATRPQPQLVQHRGQVRLGNEGANRVHYSAPYSQMRYHPEESARLTQEEEDKKEMNQGDDMLNTKTKEMGTAKLEHKNQMHGNQHTHIQIKVPHGVHEADKSIVVTGTISPQQMNTDGEQLRGQDYSQPDCDQNDKMKEQQDRNDKFKMKQETDGNHNQNLNGQEKFSRIVEVSSNGQDNSAGAGAGAVANIHPENVDVNVKSTQGHVATGSRVIAATPAPTDASASSESFHKRRIVVNHPFQTVREVVEHEPITNYHQIQVNEPAPSSIYHQHQAAAYFQTHGALRLAPTHGALHLAPARAVGVPLVYHHSASTHGNLHTAVPVAVTYHHHG